MDMRNDVNVYTDIQVLELSVDQRAHTPSSRAERTRGDRYTIANLQRGLLIVQRSNFRILNHFGIAVAHQDGQGCTRNGHQEIAWSQLRNRIQWKLVATASARAAAARACCRCLEHYAAG